MANIITDVAGIKNVRMTNARFARQPLAAVFSSWTTIRVALFIHKSDSGGNITGTPRFGFGLCSGDTNILGDATTDHFVGVVSNTATWTRTAAPARYGINYVPAKRVGSTLTTGTSLGTHTMHTTAPQFAFVDITVGSPNYSIRTLQFNNSSATPAVTEADFLLQSVATVPAATTHTYVAAQTVAVNEGTDGVLDHACVWWDQAGSTMDLLNWRVFKVA